MFLLLLIIALLFTSNGYADKICLKEIDGERVYTNMCERGIRFVSLAKSSKKGENNQKRVQKFDMLSYSKEQLEKIVDEKAQAYGVDPKLIKEVIKEESNWNIYATSPKGAMGLMQLMPSTALLMGVKNPYNPEENIDGGIRYLKYLLEKFNGNLNLALAAYNAGPALVESLGRIPNIAETQSYVSRISMRYSGTYRINTKLASSNKPSPPIRAIVLADGTVLYTNREELLRWSKN